MHGCQKSKNETYNTTVFVRKKLENIITLIMDSTTKYKFTKLKKKTAFVKRPKYGCQERWSPPEGVDPGCFSSSCLIYYLISLLMKNCALPFKYYWVIELKEEWSTLEHCPTCVGLFFDFYIRNYDLLRVRIICGLWERCSDGSSSKCHKLIYCNCGIHIMKRKEIQNITVIFALIATYLATLRSFDNIIPSRYYVHLLWRERRGLHTKGNYLLKPLLIGDYVPITQATNWCAHTRKENL